MLKLLKSNGEIVFIEKTDLFFDYFIDFLIIILQPFVVCGVWQ